MSGEHHLDKWQKLAKSLLFCLCVCVYIYTYIWKLATLIYFLCYLDMWTAKALELRWGRKDVTFPGRAFNVWMMLEKKKVKNPRRSSQRNLSCVFLGQIWYCCFKTWLSNCLFAAESRCQSKDESGLTWLYFESQTSLAVSDSQIPGFTVNSVAFC